LLQHLTPVTSATRDALPRRAQSRAAGKVLATKNERDDDRFDQ
jgi:hypothetical protein